MHLGNGAITPECVVLTMSAGAAGLATAAAAATLSESTLPPIGIRTGLPAAASAGDESPGPSAPSAIASRSGTGSVQMSAPTG